MTRVSAVVPVLDEALRIDGAVRRLLELGLYEVVVVDGGSRDATIELARGAGATVLRSRRGRSIQMNVGAAACSGDVLWFVHADVRVPPNSLDAIDDSLQDTEVVGGAFTIRTVDDVGRSRLRPVLPLADVRSRYTRLPYGDQAVFVRREAFERVGGFPLLPIFEDVALAQRLWRIGALVRRQECVEVSARRFLARPIYYTAVMNLYPILYRLGVGPDRLASWYGRPR